MGTQMKSNVTRVIVSWYHRELTASPETTLDRIVTGQCGWAVMARVNKIENQLPFGFPAFLVAKRAPKRSQGEIGDPSFTDPGMSQMFIIDAARPKLGIELATRPTLEIGRAM